MKPTLACIIITGMLLWACGSQHQHGSRCMQKIIEQDSVLGFLRNQQSKQWPLSAAISNYVDATNGLKMNRCPPAFAAAFKSHMGAWQQMIAVTDNYPHLRGEMHELFNRLEKEKDSTLFKLKLKQIWDTWAEVEKARKQ